ncbi:ABC transporter substrate-binding protein [Streptomyces sp. B22F1]|uniref:ABC transporter substrate-binding protein n=1 Tax=Streptomyces sp. B22F1 TaxID=3153566 RepID=UPI00325D4CDB
MNRSFPAAVAVTTAVSLVVLGCSPKASQSAAAPGVDGDTISLGVLTDLSGAFVAGGTDTLRGLQLQWDEINDRGGVCGRKVELAVEDHGYNTETAVSQYTGMEPDVLAFQMLLGSPMVSALTPRIGKDEVLTIPSSFAANLLESPLIALTGTTYRQETANAVHWLKETGALEGGKKIGHIYLQGEYGEDALAGTEDAAAELGLGEVAGQVVKASDKDLTAQVSALRSSGVDYVMLTTAPTQTASAVSVAKALGYDADFIGSTFTYVPSLLDGSAKGPLTEHFYQTSALAPLSSSQEGPARILEAFKDRWPDQMPNPPVVHGAGAAEVMHKVLKAACAEGDLTRENVEKTYRDLAGVDTGGLLPALDFTARGEPPTHTSYLLRPDPDEPGGLKLLTELRPGPGTR